MSRLATLFSTTLSLLVLATPLAEAAALKAPTLPPVDSKSAPAPLPKPVNIRFCIFDPVGANGQIANLARDLALQARKWNLLAEIKVYLDERVAAEDFRPGNVMVWR